MSTTPEGWFPQPDGRQRYWDGQQWTEHFAPGAPDAPASLAAGADAATTAPKAGKAWYAKKRVLIPAGIVALLIAIGALGGGGDDTAPVAADTAPTASSAPAAKQSATTAPAKPAAAKPSAAPKPVAPKVAGIGSKVRDGKFQFVVSSVKCGIARVGTSEYLQKKAQGQFCAVAMTVTNIGDEPQSMFADNQYAYDAKGRKLSADSTASIYDDSSQVLWEEINPGNAVKGKVYFDIPKGAKITKLELHDSVFSGGVDLKVG
jgi:hypothetical protein